MPAQRRPKDQAGFTIVEVMMAAVILVVGFMGMIQAVTIGSEMLATARRQTLAAQIISHHFEKLRLLPWDVSDATPNELCINDLPTANTTIPIDSQFADAISSSGVTFTLTRTVTTLTTDLREVNFTVTWTKSGTTTASSTPTGSWLQRLSFYRESPISRVYTRSSVSCFGRYGLILNIQRS